MLALLNLEKIEEGLFRGQSEDLGLLQVFGGQVVGQTLYAAKGTVPPDRLAHSFHSYFLRPCDSQEPIVYDVEVLHDGNGFSARRVAAVQNGKPIFYYDRLVPSAGVGLRASKNDDRRACAGFIKIRNRNRPRFFAPSAARREREVFHRKSAGDPHGRVPQPAERPCYRSYSPSVDPRQWRAG